MSPEALVLGLVSAVRAVPLAIVYAVLLTESPRRLLTAYLLAGAAISVVVGVLVVTAFGASTRSSENTAGRLIVDVVLGVVAIVWAAARGDGTHCRDRAGAPTGSARRCSPTRSRRA